MFRWIVVVLLSILVLGGIIIMKKNDQTVCLEEKCFNIEVASTKEERIQGLKNREKISENQGLLFILPEERESSFWMKNVAIPLDIIWVNKDKEVVFVKENAQPCQEDCPKISPGKRAKYVLEVKGGMCQKKGIEIGSKLQFSL